MTASATCKKWLENQGYLVGKTEHWNPFAHKRQDLFGFIDAICFKPHEPYTIAVQYTTKYEIPRKLRSLKDDPMVKPWLENKCRRLWVLGAKGKEVEIVEVT